MGERAGRVNTAVVVLRVGVAACFIGHGAFGLLRKPAWLSYFAALGIDAETASILMPLVGAVDILVGLSVLVRPTRPALLWAGVWGLWTALLRPIAGEPVWEALERAGNYGVPLALLLVVHLSARRSRGAAEGWRAAGVVLRWSTVLLLVGHGALALGGKPELIAHVGSIGLSPGWAGIIGVVDLTLAALVATVPAAKPLLMAAAWKVSTEALFLTAGAPAWEFIERGGSYAAPLALALLATRSVAGVRTGPARVWSRPGVRGAAAVAVLVSAVPSAGAAQADCGGERCEARAAAVPGPESLTTLVEALRDGGHVLLCRHAITDRDQSDRGSTRELQRNLDEAGRVQARALGDALRRLAIPVGDVRASPMFRTLDSAELAFGAAEVDARLRGASNADELRGLLRERPRDGNRVFMTHQGTIRRVVAIGRAPLEEGDCLVLRPRGPDASPALLARVGVSEWVAAARR